MAKVTFQYRSKKDNGNLTVRLTDSKEIDIKTSTSIETKKEYWIYRTTTKGKTVNKHRQLKDITQTDQKAKDHKMLLKDLKKDIVDSYINDKNNGIAITGDWLKSVIESNTNILDTKEKIKGVTDAETKKVDAETKKAEFINHSNLLTTAIQKMFVKYKANYDELKKYKVTNNLLLKYQDVTNQIFTIKDLNQDFADKFSNWALLDMRYSKSYINSQLKRFRKSAVYTYENDENDIINVSKTLTSFTMFKNPYKEKIVVTLNYYEIDLIDKCIIESQRLQDAKKAILIGCETGLRYSDMNKLIDTNIKNIDGINYWSFRTQKTDSLVQITITNRILYLIEKYGLPKTNYPSNNVQLNEDIKEVCKVAKINEEIKGSLATIIEINGKKETRNITDFHKKYKFITTRTFRRSFATNYYGKIDTSLITSITGHATEKQLRAYINDKDNTNIKRSKKQIDSFHKKRKKAKNNIKLTVIPKASNQN